MVISHHPRSTTKETRFTMVCIVDTMFPVETETPLWWRFQFDQEVNKEGCEYVADLVDELREVAHIQEFSTNHRATRRYNSKVMPKDMQEGILVLK